MTAISDILRTYGPEYLRLHGPAVPQNHRKVIHAISRCRTQTYGTVVYRCEKCQQTHSHFRSCGNRHCPSCQNHKTLQWLHRHMQQQLPGHHFLITFTVPESLRPFIRSNQRLAYSALFHASSFAIKRLAADPRYVGGDLPGFFGVLHTWGRQLQFHPHIHYLAPGGAFSSHDRRWRPSRLDFFLPVHALSKIFKARFKEQMQKAGRRSEIPHAVWSQDWNVNVQPVGNATHQTLHYLATYVFKVAISNRRIVSVDQGRVTFRYRKPKSSRCRVLSLDALEFIRRFLQHVLPTGFMKVRYFGFANPASSISRNHISDLIQIEYGFRLPCPPPDTQAAPTLFCPNCGGELLYCYSILPSALLTLSHIAGPDTG
jgi:hypothetical protein